MARSGVLETVWAKSARDESGAFVRWLPLWTHALDAAGVAGYLWDEWLPSSSRRRIARDLDGDEGSARTLLRFLAGVHDLGKATPAFAVQATHAIAQLSDDMRLCGLSMPRVLPPTERRTVPHGLAGQVLLVEWLVGRGWDRRIAQGYAVVVGGHHGVPPSASALNRARPGPATAHLLGVGTWEAARAELLEQVVTTTGAEEWLDSWRVHHLSPPTQALLTGLVIVADWLASNPDFFPLALPGRQPDESVDSRVVTGWRAVNLPRPWHAYDAGDSADDMLRSRFGLSDGAVARPLQRASVSAARAMDPSGLLIIEGPMGVGKTEAGMLAAEILAARTGAGGVFVALPTQATSDAMFKRLMSWVTQVPEARTADRGDDGGVLSGRAVHLAHGKAWLNPAYSDMPRWHRPATLDIGRDQEVTDGSRKPDHAETWGAAYVDRWMTGRKKGVLADFVVGTIDQVLVAALQARHVALRHLGLARKVVILDEVHAADVYMAQYLFRALEWLGAYDVPVVAMSATLPSAMRARLLDAYQGGRQPARPVAPQATIGGLRDWIRRPTTEPREQGSLVVSSRLTYRRAETVHAEPVASGSRRVEVTVERAAEGDDTLRRILGEALAEGGCALVLRNTVRRAQESYDALADDFPGELMLLHSRFTAADRKRLEDRLVAELGPPPSAQRPVRRVVVATQVAEQSLDIDFDLLVSDLAPTDLLLQRIGRLHRHERPDEDRPVPVREARCVVVGVPDWDAPPPALDRGGEAVYGRHLLYRAAAQIVGLAGEGVRVHLPDDIAPLVETAYSDQPLGPEAWQTEMALARAASEHGDERSRARALTYRLGSPAQKPTLVGWLDDSVGEAERDGEGHAQVRDSEDGVEVLLVQAESREVNASWRLPDWSVGNLAGALLPDNFQLPRDEARALAGCAVRLPLQHTRGHRGLALIEALEGYYRDAWQRSPEIQGQLVLPLGADRRARLSELCSATGKPPPPRDLVFAYDPVRGLTVEEPDD